MADHRDAPLSRALVVALAYLEVVRFVTSTVDTSNNVQMPVNQARNLEPTMNRQNLRPSGSSSGLDVHTLHDLLGSNLVPIIMSTMSGKMYNAERVDLLYITATVGVVISTITSSLQFQITSLTRSRNKLTLLTTTLLTTSLVGSIAGFHLVRHNFSKTINYTLPSNVKDLQLTNSSAVFRRHLFADIVPGFILFTQALLCLIIRFELMNRAKRTINYGEAFILAQLASLVYLLWALTTYTKLTGAGPFELEQTNEILVNLGVTIFVTAILPSCLISGQKLTVTRYCLLMATIVSSLVVTRSIVRTTRISDPLTWLVDYIFSTHQRISLFSLWLSTVAGCVAFSTSWSRLVGQTNSLVRKVFHVAICVVFITGYNQDLDFTSFASGGMVLVMIVLEMIRAWNLWPIGHRLERVCQALRGKWDNRYLTLSHIYLLIGTMVPLWLLPKCVEPNKLSLSSGLIAVGVGDTAAAVVGTFFGKTTLGARSSKTMEGFTGNILAMAAFKLIWVGYSGFIDEFSFAFAAVLTAFVEAISKNCDNLTLPLVMIIFLEIF